MTSSFDSLTISRERYDDRGTVFPDKPQGKLKYTYAHGHTKRWTVQPHILLVDDDQVYRKLSYRLLEIFGCTIDVASDGLTAVAKMRRGKYDLVFMVSIYLLFSIIPSNTSGKPPFLYLGQ